MSHDQRCSGRVAFFRLDKTTCMHLRAARDRIAPHIHSILSRFYAYMMLQPQLFDMLRGRTEELSGRQAAHWLRLFDGTFDDAYFQGAMQVGHIHHRIGLNMMWYVGGYAFALTEISRIIMDDDTTDTATAYEMLAAIQKATLLDMELVISTYIEAGELTLTQELTRISQAIESEVQSAVKAAAQRNEAVNGAAQTIETLLQSICSGTEIARTNALMASECAGSSAAAVEELSASGLEIDRQITEADQISHAALQEIETVTNVLDSLESAVSQIGSVVDLIANIAAQTNLLALNATIEAARAGEAGKGFAVVASEVKQLAKQTASATIDVRQRVEQIQVVTGSVTQGVNSINKTINRNSEIATMVSAAIIEQNTATSEISRNAQVSAQSAQSTLETINTVAQASEQGGHEIARLVNGVASTSREIQMLGDRVAGLVETLRQRALKPTRAA
ncbi:MAG: globin-coupled sensor protein [Sphingomonadales bacterium]|nr:MAG: globin-coupled sensor protein [Sphingomonadales bacterium]